MKKGDIVRLKLSDEDDSYVVVKGPYESSFVSKGFLTEMRIVVDVYHPDGHIERIPVDHLLIVARS
jgi:hypothetical protein